LSSAADDVSKRMRLIIADDQILMLDVVKRLLATDYNVIASVDRGDSAFEAITRMEPDIAVLDVSMPMSAESRLPGGFKRMARRPKLFF